MGYTAVSGYSIPITCSAFSPVDSTVYYLGNLPAAPNTTNAVRRVYLPVRGFIDALTLWVYNYTQEPSTEATAFVIRINDTTDYAVYSGSFVSGCKSNFLLNIPISAGDYLEIKVTTPAWVTNPLDAFIVGNIHIRT